MTPVYTIIDEWAYHDGPLDGVCEDSSGCRLVFLNSDYGLAPRHYELYDIPESEWPGTLAEHMSFVARVMEHDEWPIVATITEDQLVR